MNDTTKPVTNRSALPASCYHCGAEDRKLIFEPDDAQVIRAICMECRRERGREKPTPQANSK